MLFDMHSVLEQMIVFAIIMQKHVGWVGKGLLQSTILESVGNIWFNRTMHQPFSNQ